MAPGDITRGPGSTAANNGYMSVPTNSYNNNSQNGSDVRLISSTASMTDSRKKFSPFVKWATLILLFIVNLLNYMDRFTIVGVLSAVQQEFEIGQTKAALLQTVFLVSYMALSPIVGYLGDRYNRKAIILCGLIFWTAVVMGSSFIKGAENFNFFLATRAMVGIGEASYSCIAPTVITDLFEKEERSLVMSIFVIAIPLGSGVGYIAGSSMVKLASSMGWGGWEWALRVTPPIAVLSILLMVFIMPNHIPRGYSDGLVAEENEEKSSYVEDLKYLMKNKSFTSITSGFVGVAFTMGSLSMWFPQFLALAYVNRGDIPPCTTTDCEYSSVMMKFGIFTAVAGIVGVGIGLSGSATWKKERDGKPGNQRADAEICAIGQFVLAAGVFVALFAAANYPALTWAAGLIGMIGGCVNWALMVNMTMYTCLPKRRSTANAVQMFTGHILGDAFSPLLIGIIAEKLQSGRPESYYAEFTSLQYGMLLCPLLSALGGMCFLIAANYIVEDKANVDDYIKKRNYQKVTDSNEMIVQAPSSGSETSVDNVNESS